MEPSLDADSSGKRKQDLKTPLPTGDDAFSLSENKRVTAPILRNSLNEQAISSRGNSKNCRNSSNRSAQQTMSEVGCQKNPNEIKSDSLRLEDLVKTLEMNALDKHQGLSKQNYDMVDKVNGENQEETMSQQIHSIRQQKGINVMKKHPILRKNQQHQEAFIINNNNESTTPENYSNSIGIYNQDNKGLHHHQAVQQYVYSQQGNQTNQQQQQEGKHQPQLSQYQNTYSFVPLAINKPLQHQQQHPRLQLPTIVVAPKSQRPSSSFLKNYSSTLDITTTTPPYLEPSCFEVKEQNARLTKNIVINVLSNNQKKTSYDEHAQLCNRSMPIPQDNNCSSLQSSMSFEESSQYTGKPSAMPKQPFISPCSNNIFPSWHSDAKAIRKISPKMHRRQLQSKRQQQYLESIMSESQKLEALRLIALQSQTTNSPGNPTTSCKDALSHRSASSSAKSMNKQPSQDGKQQQQMYFKIVDSGKRRHSQELTIGSSQLCSARNYTHRMKGQDPLVTPQKVSAAIIEKRQAGRSNNKNNKDSGCLNNNNTNSNDYQYAPQKNSIHLQILSKLISNTCHSKTKGNSSSSHVKLTRHNSATVVNITLDKSNLSIIQQDSDSKKVKEKANNNNTGKSFPSNSNQGSSQTTLDIAALQEDQKEIILSSDDEASMSTPYCTYSMKKRRRKQSTQIPTIMTPSKEQLPQTPNKAKTVQKPEKTNANSMVSQIGQIHALRQFFQKEMTSIGSEQIVQNKLEQACQGSLIVRKLEDNNCEIAGIMQNRRRFQEYLEEGVNDKRILHSRKSLLLDNCRSRRGCQKNQQQQMNFEEDDSQIIFGSEVDRQQQYQLSEELRVEKSRQKARRFKRIHKDGGIEPWQIQLSDTEKQDEEDICSLGNNH